MREMGKTAERYKTVTVRFTIDLPTLVPADWDNDLINFHFNESSWCSSNIIEMLEEYDEEVGCLCGICKAEVL